MKPLLYWIILIVSATATTAELTVTTEPSKEIFRCGETVEFIVNIRENTERSNKSRTVVDVNLTRDGRVPFRKFSFDPAKQPLPYRISETLQEPGFLRIDARLNYDDGGALQAAAVVGFEPEKLMPGMPEPDDFIRFWHDGQKAVREIPMDLELIPVSVASTEKHTVYELSMRTVNNRRVYGFLTIPKAGRTKYPALVSVPGAGPGSFASTNLADSGVVVLDMNVFPYPVPYDDLERNAKYQAIYPGGNYIFEGVPDRERYFFRSVFLGIDRAIDYLASRPEVDSERIGIFGSSQGGGSAIILAALNPHIRAVVANVPALCDHNASVRERSPGWPHYANSTKEKSAVLEMARYFDAVNFAKYVKCPVRVIVGFLDTTCSPSSVYVMYNMLPPGKKRMIHESTMAHEIRYSYFEQQKWLIEQLNQ